MNAPRRAVGRWARRIKGYAGRLPLPPVPVRLPWGGWWLAWNDVMGGNVRQQRGFEQGECRFVLHFLRKGMTFLDIGAHQGFYTLLAAAKVEREGQIVAFEPSPREFRRLKYNLRLNRRKNVRAEHCAMGSEEGVADLYVCAGRETGCNSLRPPAVSDPVVKIQVPVRTLDAYLEQQAIRAVDFAKLDVEGAELDVLKGARRLLLSRMRPLILCELADVRTEPWGYGSAEIFRFVQALDYDWYSISPAGKLAICPPKPRYHENLVAVPREGKARIEDHLDGGKA